MDLTRWVDRIFNFDISPGLFPALVERISGTHARLEEMLTGLEKDALTRKDGSSWSIQEHTGHLIDIEEVHEKRLKQYFANMNILVPADMSNKKTYLEEHNSKDISYILKKFREVRTQFIERVSEADDYTITRVATHPRLNKEMRLVDMIYFMAEHDDHHLAIIRSLINNQKKHG